jgi:magnesium and cobalt transporter
MSNDEPSPGNGANADPTSLFMKWLKGVVRGGYKTDNSLREALEEYIQATPDEGTADISVHERLMLANVLKMRDLRVVDVMIPRADIVAVNINITREEFFALLAERQYSRFPVFRETLDDVIGTIHIKDIMAHLVQNKSFVVRDLVRDVPVVSPALPVSDLIMQMRENKKHMVMVVDEYGGIDGLVTIGDVIETIFGQIGDEYDRDESDMIAPRPDGTFIIDTRLSLDEFESRFGKHFSDEERENNDTIGGLVFAIAGHVPARGEIIRHETSPLKFEVVDGDSRRIFRLRVKNIPSANPLAIPPAG